MDATEERVTTPTLRHMLLDLIQYSVLSRSAGISKRLPSSVARWPWRYSTHYHEGARSHMYRTEAHPAGEIAISLCRAGDCGGLLVLDIAK